jgi:hypothetical protein
MPIDEHRLGELAPKVVKTNHLHSNSRSDDDNIRSLDFSGSSRFAQE